MKKYVNEDKDFLLQELEIVNPDIIVCGYTCGMLKTVLKEEKDTKLENIGDTMYGFWRDKLIIDYYHPACYYPNRVNYYALMSICKAASEEWKESVKYKKKKNSNIKSDEKEIK